MGGSRLARAGGGAARARHPVICPEADQVFCAERPWRDAAGKVRPVASVQFVMRIAARRSSARSAASVPDSPIPESSGRGSRWVIAEESLAPNGRKTVVSYTLRLLPGGGEGGPSVVSWRSVPPVGHEIPGGPPAFGFLVVGLAPEYPRVISPSPVIQVFAAHAAIARERRKHSHGKCREFPPNLAGEPRSRAAPPAALQATRPRPSIGWLADPPEGWTTSMTLPLATKRMGRKMPSPAGCRCGSEGSAQH
jgi:hypothetical protein